MAMAQAASSSRTSSIPASVSFAQVDTQAAAKAAGIPWYLWCAALAVTSVTIGAHWDVSWHRSIGRDTFWTPAHMAIYACGVLAGIACGYLILVTTFVRPQAMVASSVRVLGFRGPLGAFLAAWGGIAMLTSAPFDNWWHNAYGLDVKIISPPHTLLMVGIWAVCIGALFLVVAEMNRALVPEGSGSESLAASREFRNLQWLMLYTAGLMLVLSMFFRMEYTWSLLLHNTDSYIAVAMGTPLYFAAVHVCSRNRWAATWMAAIYTVFLIGLILILPLFPAEPKLGPVYQHVTHFVPPQFPVLILVPAVLTDLLLTRAEKWKPWLLALVGGPLFVLSLVAVEWPFASFLMTPAAVNRFFGTGYFDYATPSRSPEVRHILIDVQHGAALWGGLGRAMVYAAISVWLGLALGRWMRRIQR
ncbi:hypothetical protein [Silvibacterium sp.]|uniref:hypothetical protein n=1 Tax=Silvibacterium sp. TaxID=1964179 RepID=UPI0039E5F98D